MVQVDRLSSDKVYVNDGNVAVLALVRKEQCTILDVGCGAGSNALRLVAKGHSVDGITLSSEEATICKAFMHEVWVHNLEQGLPGDLKRTYDYVICSHVLEHVVNPQNLLEGIRLCLKPGGQLIVALPNIMHYRSRIKLVVGDFDYAESGIWDYTHVRWYTYRSGRQLLVRNGYEVITSFVDGDIPLRRIFGFLPGNIRQILYRGLTWISKGLFGGQLIYVAKVDNSRRDVHA
jgi:SAM-dependent methyltransferase